MSGLTAVLAGATGLVGGECLKRLLASRRYGRVVVVSRRPLESGGRSRKLETVITDFDRLDEVAAQLAGDHVFCALGTTIRKAGSQARFRVVDHDYPLRLAEITLGQGARHFSLVSALGASRSSPFSSSAWAGRASRCSGPRSSRGSGASPDRSSGSASACCASLPRPGGRWRPATSLPPWLRPRSRDIAAVAAGVCAGPA